jgi:hypothetical protein
MLNNESFIKSSLIFIFLFGLSLIIRLNFGYDSSIWLDEAWRITISRSYHFENWLDIWKYAFTFEGLLILNDFLLSENISNYRILFVLISSFSSPFLFILARNFFNTKLSFIIALLIASSSWHVTYSNEIAAYGIGATFTLIFCIILFSDKYKSEYTKISLVLLIASMLGIIHIYLIGLTLLLLTTKYLSEFLNYKNYKSLIILFVLIFLVFLINSGQIYNRFFEFSGTQVFNGASSGWITRFPFHLVNVALSGPLSNYWIPTSYDLSIIFICISLLVLIILTISVMKFCILIYSNFNLSSIKTFIKNEPKIVIIFSATIGYTLFIYVQAFFVNGEFMRYALPLFPLILICLFYLFKKTFKGNIISPLNIGLIMIIINIGVLYNGNFSTHFKNPYAKIFNEIEESCLKKDTIIITPEFLELAIVKFYLSESNCNLITQPSFNDFFMNKNKSLIWQDKEARVAEDEFLIEESLTNGSDADQIIIMGARSGRRISDMVKDNRFSNYNITNNFITNLELGFRVVTFEKNKAN